MNVDLKKSLGSVKNNLFGKGFFSSNFKNRIVSKLKKGVITFTSIVALTTSLNLEAKGNFSDTLRELKNISLQISSNPHLSEEEKDILNNRVANKTVELSERILSEINELIVAKDYDKALNDAVLWYKLVSVYEDTPLKKSIERIIYDIKDVKSSTNNVTGKEISKLSFNDLKRLDAFQRMDLIKLISNNYDLTKESEVVNYLAKIYISGYPLIDELEEGRFVNMTSHNVRIRFKINNGTIIGVINLSRINPQEFYFKID
ncbi:MAG: hypothetical protein ACMXX9_01550 [Candidatus Woesearchaeota archaeon]